MFYPLGGGMTNAEVTAAVEAANNATKEATAAAKACEGIVAGQNTITDDTTAKVYRLGINEGNIYREEIK